MSLTFLKNSENTPPMVRIRRFAEYTQARLAELQLLQEGIPCYLSNVNSAQALPFETNLISLYVREDYWEEAVDLLGETAIEPLLSPMDGVLDAPLEHEAEDSPANRLKMLTPWIFLGLIILPFFLHYCA
jgi:hypothetical protein